MKIYTAAICTNTRSCLKHCWRWFKAPNWIRGETSASIQMDGGWEKEHWFSLMLERRGFGWGRRCRGGGAAGLEMRSSGSWRVTNQWGPEFQDVALLPPLEISLLGKKKSIWFDIFFFFCLFSHTHPAPPWVRNLIWGLRTAKGLADGRHEKGSCCGQGAGKEWGGRPWSGQIVSSSNATPEQFPKRSALKSAADRQSDCRCRTRSQALFKCKSGCVTRLHGAEGGSQKAPSLWRILEVEKTF